MSAHKALTLIFTLLLVNDQIKSSITQECILSAVASSFELDQEQLTAIQNFQNEENFSVPESVTNESLPFLLFENDAQTFSEIQKLIMAQISELTMFEILTNCGVKEDGPKRRCEQFYGDDHCQKLAPFVWGKKCEPGLTAFGLNFCVPICPFGLNSIENDPFFCERSLLIQRASDFDDKEYGKKTKIVNGLEIRRCPDGFRTLGYDFCQMECPVGWNEVGGFCQKPLVHRRKFEIFVFDFSIDDYLTQHKNI